ncbi:MAG: hypothetical protein CVU78_06225 [Elusimicrobia bacterium HGW-Elusimicrobia-2]|nr:MAG: hypothetical protein CVU78_06225 [Elusimicrobia bacterium HGW-Elusimicrobia-2]
MHNLIFLNFAGERGRAVESCLQVISVSLNAKKPVTHGILERGRGVMNICTGHNTNTTNFFKEEKEKGEK